MAQVWKTVRVFISSTFRDMQAERDHLVRFVFPRLHEELLPRRIHLVDVDLRWGITSEQDVSEVCREIIDECRPRFLCMLGGRYGWVPPGKNRSITADEVHYGVLDRKLNDHGFAYFYFRDDAATAAMVETTPGELREPQGSDNQKKLDNLKEAVIDEGLNLFTYPAQWDKDIRRLTGLKKFGDRVYDDLLGSIKSDPELRDCFVTDMAGQLDEFAEENAAMEAFVEERSERFVLGSRGAVLEELLAHASATGGNGYVCLTGAPGSGKSALLAHLSKHSAINSQSSILLIHHFVGASPDSTDVRRTLRRLCNELKAGCPEITADIPNDPEKLHVAFPDFLRQACECQRVVILLDAVNQFDSALHTSRLHWLPENLPPNARIILSALEGTALEELRHRKLREIELQPLTPADGEAIIEQFLKRYSKKFEQDQRAALLAKSDAVKPLYLLAALEELRTLGTYAEISQRIVKLPPTTNKLFAWILDRLENDDGFRDASGHCVGRELVSRFAELLGVSGYGLSQRELTDLLDEDDSLGNVAALLHLLRPYLMRRGELLDFYHGQFKEAVGKRYLRGETERVNAHKTIADYFETRWREPNHHALRELPYHLQKMCCWTRLTDWLTNSAYLREYCLYFGPHDLLIYSETSLQHLEASEARASRLSVVCETLGCFGSLLGQEPQALLQQLYLFVYNYWSGFPEMRHWADQALALTPQKRPLCVVRGPCAPRSPLFRDLGVQDDFVPEIGASPDFGRLFSASMSGQLRCFDVVSGTMLGENVGSVDSVLALKVLDENSVLLGLMDGSVVKLDGEYIVSHLFRVPGDYSVNSLALMPESGWLLLGPGQWKSQPQSGKLCILDLRTYQQIGEVDLNDRIVLTFARTWQQRRVFNPDGAQVNQMVRRPHSREIAFAFHHGEVSLFDPDRGQWRRVHASSTEAAFGIAFDERGDHLFFADSAGRLVDFDLTSWCVRSCVRFPHGLTALATSDVTRQLLVGDWLGMVYVVRQKDLSIQQSFPGELRGCVRSLCCDSTGRLVAASGRSIRVFLTDTERPSLESQIDWGWQAMHGHGSGDLNVCVATTLGGGAARAVAIDTAQTAGSAPLRSVYCARRVPLALVENLSSSGIAIVSLPELTETIPIEIAGLQNVHGLALDDQGTFAACMVRTAEGTSIYVFLVNPDENRVSFFRRFSVRTRPGRFMPMVFSPELSRLAAVTSQCADLSKAREKHIVEHYPVTVAVWQISSGNLRALSLETPVRSLAFSFEGERLFIGPGTQFEYAEDPEDLFFTEVRQFKSGMPVDIHAIRVFDVRSGEELPSFKGHTDSVNTLAVSADNKFLLSAADDCTLRLWDVRSHKCLGLIGLDGKPLWCGFTANEGEIAVVCAGWRADLRVLTKVLRFE